MGFIHPKIKMKEKIKTENETHEDKELKTSSIHAM